MDCNFDEVLLFRPRQKIVDSVDSYENKEGSIRQLAKRFKVSPDCVRRLLKRFYQEGTIEPKSYSGGYG